MEAIEYWYRVEDISTTAGPVVYLHGYKVERQTPKGVWLDLFDTQRFVLHDARKRFACPTKAEAIESFRRRKIRQIAILSYQLDRARHVLYLVTHGSNLIHDTTTKEV